MKDTEKKINFMNLLAFIALITVAVLEVFNGLDTIGISIFGEGSVLLKILNSIKNICIIFVIGLSAYKYVENKPKGYKIAYWCAIAVFVVATIIMWIPNEK